METPAASTSNSGLTYTFSDSLLSVENNALAGFNLALLASLNVNQTIRIRFIPGLSFQDRGMLFRFRNPDGTTNPVSVRTESVFLDFPLIVKLRTERIGNFAPYALVGGKISRDMQSQADVNQSLQDGYILKLAKNNSSLDFGAGADFFLPVLQVLRRAEDRVWDAQRADPGRHPV